jgi:hypothetical protein
MQPIVNVDVTTVFYACPATFRKKDFRDRQQLFHMWKSAQQVFKERMAFQRALENRYETGRSEFTICAIARPVFYLRNTFFLW